MRAMIEIEWMDGLVTKVPEFALGDVFGESVQVELDFKFDDVSGASGSRCAIINRTRARMATRAKGPVRCMRTVTTVWSTRSTSTVSSAFSLRGSRGSAASRGSS